MLKLSMEFSNESSFLINENVAYVKDKLKDQYNIIFLDSDDEADKDNKIFIAKGSSYYIWQLLVEDKNYGDILSNLSELFDPFGEQEISQVDSFLNQIIDRGFIKCKS